MEFLDNVVKSSNAILKERLNNPFGKQQTNSQASASSQSGQQLESSTSIQQEKDQSNDDSTTNTHDQTPLTKTGNNDSELGDKNSQFAAIAADAEVVAQKAAKGAKNIGNFLFSMANKAGQTVTQTAKQVKQVVESTSILTDLTREQQEFIKEHGGSIQAGELPWTNCGDETKSSDIREQILSLSQDKRNFVRGPPNEANFQFDPQQCYPVALSLMKEDPNLGKMRFELVPKLVNEDTFWRNYFYRVNLLKQMSDRGDDIKRQGWSSSRSSSGEGPDEVVLADDPNQSEDHPITGGSSFDQNFGTGQQRSILNNQAVTSQDFETSEDSSKLLAEADDLKSKLRELNLGSLDEGGGQDDNDKWEEELQKDLQEFELIPSEMSAMEEEALDKFVMELNQNLNRKK